MLYTREMVIKGLADKTGYFMKDVRNLLLAYDGLVEELLSTVTDDEDVSVQLVRGVKVINTILQERERVDPRDHSPIVCPRSSKVKAKVSETLKENMQKKYEESKKSE